jgi:hypothetical protein
MTRAVGEKGEDFPLAGGQLGHLGWCGCVLVRSGSEFVDESAGDGGTQPGLASGYRADRGGDVGGGGIFEEVARGAGAQCSVDVLIEVEDCEDNDSDGLAALRGQGLIDHSAGRGDAVGAWHAYIHEDYIRAVGADLGKSVLAVGGFGDDGDVFFGVGQYHYAGSCQRLIIDYHDSDHADTFP